MSGILAAIDFRAYTFPRTIPGAPPLSSFNASIAATIRRLDASGVPIWTSDGSVTGIQFMPTIIQLEESRLS